MSKFTIEFETGNDAFGEPGDDFRAAECRAEVARILRNTAGLIEAECKSGPILDANGNRVGSYHLAED